MIKNRILNFLMLTIIAVGCVWGARAQATWMGDNAALLGKKQLNELVIPGTHDTGTFGIIATKSKGIGLGDSDGLSSPDNKKVKRFLSFGSVFTDWAKTQEKTSLEMLDDGVRYFDLRVCVDNKGVFMTCHGLYGAPLETILDDVKKFTDAHPREVVLLGFNHFWDRQYQTEMGKKQGELEGLTKANWTALVALVKTKLGDKLVSGKTFGPASRLGELWQLKQNNQVIALFDTDDAPDDEFLWKRREENTWVGGWDPDVFKSGTLKVLENAKSGRYAGKFFAVRSSVTPDDNGQLIGMGFLSKVYPKSNSELADQTNPVALGWIRNEWAGKYPLNLIWCDFYNRADLVKLAKSLNGIKVDFTGTKIGTDTNWTKWKTSKDAKK